MNAKLKASRRTWRDPDDTPELTHEWIDRANVYHGKKLVRQGHERQYRAMVAFMNNLLDKVGDRETHPLMGPLDIVTVFVRDHEERNVEIPDAEPAAVLRFLMEQHGLRQTDLAELFGSQSNVSEALSGKRKINSRQARALAKRFGVSVAVFV